jgi:hypothetical protein
MVVLAEPYLKFISFSTGRSGCPVIVLGRNYNDYNSIG